MQRAQFLFELSSITSNEPETYDEIFKSLAHSLTLQSSLGLSSHLLLAWFLSPLPDLSSYYLLECANRIIDGSFDDDLKVFFGITALDSSSRVTSKSAKVADFIVQMFEDIELLETTISRHGTDKMVRTIHDLFEVTRITKNEELFLKIRKIAERLLLRAEFCIKDKLRVFLDFHDLQNKNNKGENININETLSRWENWKEHWLYSSVLELSFNNRRADQTLIVKSLDYLESRESPFTASSHVHLLHKIVDEVVKGNANKYYQRCTNLLIRKVVPILQNYSVQNALITFELLSQIDATNIVTHHQYHAQWNAIQLERVKIENLGHMIEKGYFWGVFDNYFRALLIYGLPISRNDESFCEKVLNAKPDSYLEIFKAYDLDEQLRLTKIVDGQEVILFDFICIGRMAFSSGIQGLPIVDELRHKINHVTKNQIGHFFNIIASTQSIPLILRDIISQHRKELSV